MGNSLNFGSKLSSPYSSGSSSASSLDQQSLFKRQVKSSGLYSNHITRYWISFADPAKTENRLMMGVDVSKAMSLLAKLQVPGLFIESTYDTVFPPTYLSGQERYVAALTYRKVPSGYFAHVE